MKYFLFFIFLFFSISFFSQTTVKDTLTRVATIGFDKKGNQVSLKPQTPPLVQIAGAPKANYTYFWEMGDGNFSKEENPKHVYKKTGEYKVNLSVTNNYDNGKPPKTRPKIVAVNEITDTNYTEMASLNDSISIKLYNNREPSPNEEMIVMLSYKNNLDYTANGKLYLFYNDKEFKNDNFELLESRTHFGEKEVFENGVASVDELNTNYLNVASTENIFPIKYIFNEDENLDLTLLDSKAKFRNMKAFEFDGMEAKETRNLFFTFKTTPEMLKDTSATVKMRGVYVPDRNFKNHKKKTLEMEIVTSHDPNKMSSNATVMNYRLVRFKTFNFKTRFQNDGKGQATTIRLETDIPDMFDKKTLKIVDSYPKCPICPKGQEVIYSCIDTLIKQKQIHFTFKNIYLPGSQQKNVTEKDSTKGFVKYSMKLGKDFHKQTTKSRTSIFFDKNEPVITNYAVTRFLPGISIGVRTGYNLYTNNNLGQSNAENSISSKPKSYFLGATISPFKSYRFYWQAELTFNYLENNYSSQTGFELQQFTPPIQLSNGTVVDGAYVQTSAANSYSRKSADVVPISLRYNINNYIGVGIGPQFSITLNEKSEFNRTTKYYTLDFNNTPPTIGDEITELQSESTTANSLNAFDKMQTSIFADATFGFARIGPSVGIRYYKSFEKESNYWQFYAIWKF
jgi:PKD repeat protein